MMGFLLAMQAAGMVVDYVGTQQQMVLSRMGAKADQASIETNLQMTRAQSEQASLMEMQELRKNLGTQAAIQAARGTSSSAGSAFSLQQESISNFSSDEKARKMNLLANEAGLRAGSVMSSLNQYSNETQLGQAMGQRMVNTVSSNPYTYAKMAQSFGMTPVKGK